MVKVPTAKPLRRHVFTPLSPVAEAFAAGIGAAALVLLVVVPLAIAVRIELRSVRADRLYREAMKSSDREQQASHSSRVWA
jgi:hypothetical protein